MTTCYRCATNPVPKGAATCEPCEEEIYRSNPLGTSWRPPQKLCGPLERVERLEAALAPFVGIRDQFPQTIQLIDPKLDGLTPITVTVTKTQFLAATNALAKARSEQ